MSYTLQMSLGDTKTSRKLLFTNGNNFLVASFSHSALDPEVLLFKADETGEVTNWTECFGEKHERGVSPLEAIYSTVTTYNRVLEDNNYNGAWE